MGFIEEEEGSIRRRARTPAPGGRAHPRAQQAPKYTPVVKVPDGTRLWRAGFRIAASHPINLEPGSPLAREKRQGEPYGLDFRRLSGWAGSG